MREKFSKFQWIIFFTVAAIHFLASICISLQAPFYPVEAESKGVSATEYGLVFGCFELIGFIFSPLFGNTVNKVGVKLMIGGGMFACSVSSILFGLLHYVQNRDVFLILSFAFRIIESVGTNAAIIAAFSLTSTIFPKNVATMFATFQTFFGVGYIVGPTIGGILYHIGGFTLPFVLVGVLTGFTSLSICLTLPARTNVQEEKTDNSIFKILKIPSVLIDSACIVSVAISTGFFSATLEPHIRDFNLEPLCVGFIFVISGATYAVIGPFIGRIIDRCGKTKYFMMFGCVMDVASFCLIGPAPFLPLSKTLPLCVIALIFHGLCTAAINVPTFIDAMKSIVQRGFPDDSSTYGLVSGMWASSFALGAFIGPSIAGFLYDKIGFENASLFIIAVHFILFWILVIYVNLETKCWRKVTVFGRKRDKCIYEKALNENEVTTASFITNPHIGHYSNGYECYSNLYSTNNYHSPNYGTIPSN